MAGSLAAAGLALAGCGDVESPAAVSHADQALLNAPLDVSHPADVGVCIGRININPAAGPVGACRSGTARCSGTLIAPNLVLTARHCLVGEDYGPAIDTNPCDGDFNTTPLRAGGTHITTSPSTYAGTPKWYEAQQILVPEGTRACETDIALVILSSNVPAAEAVPVEIDTRSLTKHTPKNIAIVGRGSIDETFTLDANLDWTGGYSGVRGDLMRRVSENIEFRCVSDGPRACTIVDHEVPTTHVFTAALSQFIAGPAAASGDSGAGVFDQQTFAKYPSSKVIGVASWNFIGPDGKPSGTGVQRLDPFKKFLHNALELAASAGGYAVDERGDAE